MAQFIYGCPVLATANGGHVLPIARSGHVLATANSEFVLATASSSPASATAGGGLVSATSSCRSVSATASSDPVWLSLTVLDPEMKRPASFVGHTALETVSARIHTSIRIIVLTIKWRWGTLLTQLLRAWSITSALNLVLLKAASIWLPHICRNIPGLLGVATAPNLVI